MANPKHVYVRVDDVADLKWLEKLCDNWLARDPNNEQLQVNFIHIHNWKNYISNNVVPSKEVYEAAEESSKILLPDEIKKNAPLPKKRGRPPSKKTKAAKKKKESQEVDPFSCPHHPTYTGLTQRPRTDCDDCWNLYGKFNKDKVATMRAAFNSKRKLS